MLICQLRIIDQLFTIYTYCVLGCLRVFLLKHNSRPNPTTPPIQAHWQRAGIFKLIGSTIASIPSIHKCWVVILIFLMTSSSSFWKKLEIKVPLVFFWQFSESKNLQFWFLKSLRNMRWFPWCNRQRTGRFIEGYLATS